jgi:hypothetical protein
MASISTDKKTGNRRILFSLGKGKGSRKQLRLGKMPMKTASEINRRIELLITAHETTTSVDRETAEWLGGLVASVKMRTFDFG